MSSQLSSATPYSDAPILPFVRTLFSEWRRIVAVGFGFSLLLGTIALLRAPRFTTSTLLIPSAPSSGSASQLRGLASQLGLGDAAGALSPTASPTFIAQLATSDVILSGLLTEEIELGGDSKSSVMELASPTSSLPFIGEASPEKRGHKAVKQLRRWISARADRETGSVRITVRTQWPEASFELARLVAERIDRLNLEISSSRAGEERAFVEGRVLAQRQSLLAAESALQRFLESNREYRSSATLTFAHDRLQRDVELQQSVLNGLAQSLEDARIREVQDTPTLAVVEPPRIAVIADSRRTVQRAILGLIAGCLLSGVALVSIAALRMSAASGNADAAEVLALLPAILRTSTKRGAS